jgi:hypothetical protein
VGKSATVCSSGRNRQLWVTDIAEYPAREMDVCRSLILDGSSRRIVR